ncbi:MAG TPA: cell division protein ZapA [Chitinophagales bacterium]|nr:cell division protein ZapA [Chitinophagales bacterium]HRK28122.1 cell division protein ZapA [Chitinophagales bacterium]
MDNTREKDIKVIIADRTYKIKVLPEDEDRVVQAAKIIKNRMRELQEAYGAKDKYDYLAMASLLICVELIEKQERSVYENNDIDVRLSQLDELLTDFIRKS